MYLERSEGITISGMWNRVWGVSTLSDLMSQYPTEELLTANPDTDIIGGNILKCLLVFVDKHFKCPRKLFRLNSVIQCPMRPRNVGGLFFFFQILKLHETLCIFW